MSKPGILITLGVLVALIPFLGFPQSWDTVLLIAFGLSSSIFAFWLGREMKMGAHCDALHHGKETDSYVQNGMIRHDSANRTGEEGA